MIPKKYFEILAVDDDALILELLEVATRPFGNRVHLHVARNVHDAVELTKRHRFDLAMLDHELDGVMGWQLLDYLRPMMNKNVPFLVYSGSVDDAARQAYTERGVGEILAKPLTVMALGFAIRRALGI